MVTKEQFVNAVVAYADSEVMPYLTTEAKWIVGAAMFAALQNSNSVMNALLNHPLIKSLSVCDENGMIDNDLLIEAFKSSSSKYGPVTMSLPIVGNLTFNTADIEKIGAKMKGVSYG